MLKKTLTKNVYDCRANELLNVVADVKSYANFIPFCSDVEIYDRSFSEEIENGFFLADAVVVLTEWSLYSEINWIEMSKKMRAPAWVFDARSIINQSEVKKAKLNFWRIGDGS